MGGANAVPNGRTIRVCLRGPYTILNGPTERLTTFNGATLLRPNRRRRVYLAISLCGLTSCSTDNTYNDGSTCIVRGNRCCFCLNNSIHDTGRVFECNRRGAAIFRRLHRYLTPRRDVRIIAPTSKVGNGLPVGETYPRTERGLHRQVLDRLPGRARPRCCTKRGLDSIGDNGVPVRRFISLLDGGRLRTLAENSCAVGDGLNTTKGTNTFTKILPSLHGGKVPPIVAASNPSKVHLDRAYSLVPANALLTYDFSARLIRRMCSTVNTRVGSHNDSILLTPKVGVREGPLYNEGFRCCSRSPLLDNGVTTTTIQNVRSHNISTYVGRFTYGGRRFTHAIGSSEISRHTLERVCLGNFRVYVGRTGPRGVVASCGGVGNICDCFGCSLYASILHNR